MSSNRRKIHNEAILLLPVKEDAERLTYSPSAFYSFSALQSHLATQVIRTIGCPHCGQETRPHSYHDCCVDRMRERGNDLLSRPGVMAVVNPHNHRTVVVSDATVAVVKPVDGGYDVELVSLLSSQPKPKEIKWGDDAERFVMVHEFLENEDDIEEFINCYIDW